MIVALLQINIIYVNITKEDSMSYLVEVSINSQKHYCLINKNNSVFPLVPAPVFLLVTAQIIVIISNTDFLGFTSWKISITKSLLPCALDITLDLVSD